MTWTLLISLLAKSSLVAGAGLAASRFLTRNPIERVDILRATVGLLLALPVIMNALPPIELALLPPLPTSAVAAAPLAASGAAPAVAPPSPWTSPGAMLGGLWLLGAALISGRLALGLRTLTLHDAFNDALSAAEMYVQLTDMQSRGVRIARARTHDATAGITAG